MQNPNTLPLFPTLKDLPYFGAQVIAARNCLQTITDEEISVDDIRTYLRRHNLYCLPEQVQRVLNERSKITRILKAALDAQYDPGVGQPGKQILALVLSVHSEIGPGQDGLLWAYLTEA